MKEFKINKYITLKLEEDKTIIYVNGERFNQCKHLFFINPQKNNIQWKINSIDEAESELNYEKKPVLIELTPEEEFWGHCSNLQAWAENKYNTELLHSNLAFPLLKRMTEIGVKWANIKLREEIVKRLKNGYFNTIKYLIEENYLSFLTEDDSNFMMNDINININFVMEKMEKGKLLSKILKSTLAKDKYKSLKNLEKTLGITLKVKEYKANNICVGINNKQMSSLCLAGLKIERIPKEIINFPTLENLDLSNCKLKEIPDWLSELNNLKKLNLWKNNLSSIPTSLERLNKLEDLSLARNFFEIFPKIICRLTNLRYLSINRKIKSIPLEIGNLTKLIMLDLDRNNLEYLPNTIGKLCNVESLNLMRNSLKSIPSSIKNMKNLRWLDLRHNTLTEIPDSIAELPNLQYLIINKNPIHSLPISLNNNKLLKKIQIDKSQSENISKYVKNKLGEKLKII